MKFVALETVNRGDWFIKASVLDEQLLIFLYNPYKIRSIMKIFYNEEEAYNYIESIVND